MTPPALPLLAGICAGRSGASAKSWKEESRCGVLGPTPGGRRVWVFLLELREETQLGIQNPGHALDSDICFLPLRDPEWGPGQFGEGHWVAT